MPNMIQIKAIVKGRVQGVFYRAHTQKQADRLGVKGYVKNLPDGSVEAVFEGDPKSVSQMVKWCHQGPKASFVEHVLAKEADGLSNFETFKITY